MIGYSESRLKGVPSGPNPDAMVLRFVIPSQNYTLTIPFFNTTGYNGLIDWKDGSQKSTITSYLDTDRIHVYATAGTYDVELMGVFKGLYFNNTGNCLQLTKIVQWGNIGMTSLAQAFSGCTNLLVDELTIPSSVTSIGNESFYGCSGLTGELIIPSSVTSIGNYAFWGCTGLNGSLVIPGSVTSIGSQAFYNCTSMTSLTIPSSVTSIGINSFQYWSSDTSLTIPSSVTSIGNYAFYGWSSATSLTIPSSVTSIGTYAFGGWSSATSLTIPSSITSIGTYAFGGWSSATSLTIPSSITSIGNQAFYMWKAIGLAIWMESTTPPTLGGSSVFDGTNATMRIKVPAASVTAYQTATYWSEYASKIISQ